MKYKKINIYKPCIMLCCSCARIVKWSGEVWYLQYHPPVKMSWPCCLMHSLSNTLENKWRYLVLIPLLPLTDSVTLGQSLWTCFPYQEPKELKLSYCPGQIVGWTYLSKKGHKLLHDGLQGQIACAGNLALLLIGCVTGLKLPLRSSVFSSTKCR